MNPTAQFATPTHATADVVTLTSDHLSHLSARSATLTSRFYRSVPRHADGLRWRWCPQPTVPPQVVARLSTGDGDITLALDQNVPLTPHSTHAWRAHEGALRVLAFVAAHDTLLDWLQTALGCELTVEHVAQDVGDTAQRAVAGDAALTLGFTFCHDDGAVIASGLVSAPRRCALRAARNLSLGKPALPPTALPLQLQLQLEVDRFDVPSRALADLTAGCFVRLTNRSLANNSARVALTAGHWRLPADVHERTLCVRRVDPVPTRPIAGHNTGYVPMTDVKPDTVPDLPHLEALPVQLRFCAGNVTLTLAAAQSLRPGQAIALDRGLDEAPITVYANDTAVARGDLVLIGDVLGVRITRTLGAND